MFCFKAHLVARGLSELSHLSRTSRPASSRGRLHVEQDQERTCFVCRVQHLAFLRADTYGFGDKHANKQKKQKHSNVCKGKREVLSPPLLPLHQKHLQLLRRTHGGTTYLEETCSSRVHPPSCLQHGVPPSGTEVNTHTHTHLADTPDYIDNTKKNIGP